MLEMYFPFPDIGSSRTMTYVYFWLIPNIALYDAEQDILWIAEREQTETTWTKWVRVDVAVEPWAYGRRVPHFGLWSPDPFRTKIIPNDRTASSVPILELADRLRAGERIEDILGRRTEETSPPLQDSSYNPVKLRS